jgi:hypothetical protein
MNHSSRPDKNNLLFLLSLVSAVVVGLFLRVYLLKDRSLPMTNGMVYIMSLANLPSGC